MGFHEIIADDEQARFEGFGAELVAIMRKRDAGGSLKRALHVKQHLGVVGAFVVDAEAAGQVGIFAEKGRSYPVYVRFSNGSSAHGPDKAPDVRGMALKLVGVEGKKIIQGLENEVTQDFLFLNDPALPFRDPNEFMAFQRAAKDGPTWLVPKLFKGVGWGRGFAILKRALGSVKVGSYATHSLHTCAAITFGSTAAKLSLVATPSAARALATGNDYFRDDLIARLKEGPLSWTLRAQPFVDDQSTPIEDASVVWAGPWLTLGTLTLPQQDAGSARGQEVSSLVESFSFDPWHSIEAHRPLGAIMRARAPTYKASSIARGAAMEPKSVLSAG